MQGKGMWRAAAVGILALGGLGAAACVPDGGGTPPAPKPVWCTKQGVARLEDLLARAEKDDRRVAASLLRVKLRACGDLHGGTDGHADGNVDGNADGGIDGQVDGGVDGNVDGGTDGQVDGNVDGNVDGGIDGQVDGNVDGNVDGGLDGGTDSSGPDCSAELAAYNKEATEWYQAQATNDPNVATEMAEALAAYDAYLACMDS